MKIGILTFHYAHNYGAMLQAYALKSYLRKCGHEVEIINYVPDYMRIKYFQMSKIRMLALLKRSVVKAYFKQKGNIEKFDNFEKEYLGVSIHDIVGKSGLKKESDKFDYIILGSDQVWNTHITFGDMSYFCDFTNQNKAIAYAASCGNSLGSKEFENAVTRYVSHYKAISVRENNACKMLSEKYNLDVKQVLDPVFLIDSVEWDRLSEKTTCKIKGDYVFYYAIEDNHELINECESYASQNGLRVVTAHGEMKTSMAPDCLLKGIGPVEFVYLIKNAKIVFTNSFHAVAFSILFKKDAYIRTHSQTGNRVIDLLNTCGINWSGEGLFNLEGNDYTVKLEKSVKESKNYLRGALGDLS